jgi:hypothetical protein
MFHLFFFSKNEFSLLKLWKKKITKLCDTGWFSIAFHNFEDMLYDHKQVKIRIHIGPETSLFRDTST